MLAKEGCTKQQQQKPEMEHSPSVVLVMAGHISEADISCLSADPRLPIIIRCLSLLPYVSSIQYFFTAYCFAQEQMTLLHP